MTGNTDGNQGSESTSRADLDATVVQAMATSAGLRLDARRAALIAPFVSDALAADAALAQLDMGDSASAGAPWGRDEHDT